jgi:5S rRNA maturation endonuclease (ribonuclease M5)
MLIKKFQSFFSVTKDTSEGFRTICPFHSDSDPSLWITEKELGFFVGKCHAGCSDSQINDYVKEKAIEFKKDYKPKLIKEIKYPYLNENGKFLFHKIRKYYDDGSKSQYIHPSGVKERVLFNLPKVLTSDTVFLVEGEKDVLTLENYGLVGACNQNGSGEKWIDEYTTPLLNKKLYIIPDNDEAGYKHAIKVKNKLPHAEIIILPFSNFGTKEDITDWLESNSIDNFKRLLDKPASLQFLINQISSIKEKEVKPNKLFCLSDDFAMSCHGLIGDITKWIVENSKYPQPALALGAALCAVGTIKGKKVCFGSNDLRTNLYILAFAPSAGGKGAALKGIRKLFKFLNINCYLGDIQSDSALARGVAETRGITFIEWDEIGEAMKHMAGEKAQAHYKKIATELTKLFSSADSTYLGKQYANTDGKRPRIDINQPCVNLYGATNLTSFIESLNSGQFSNGFLPRFLPISVENERKIPLPDFYLSDPPVEILEKCFSIMQIETQDELNNLIKQPKKVFPSDDASKRLREIELEYANKINENEKSNHESIAKSISAVLGRGYEHTCKVALVLCNDDEISLEDVNYAHKLVSSCIDAMCYLAEHEAPRDEYVRQIDDVYEHILSKGDKGATQASLYRCTTPRIRNKQDMKVILDTLVDSGKIINKGGGKRGVVWIAL